MLLPQLIKLSQCLCKQTGRFIQLVSNLFTVTWHKLCHACREYSTSVSMYYSTRSKKFSLKNKKDLGMACHIPPLKKAKKQGEMPLPSLGPIPSLNSTFF